MISPMIIQIPETINPIFKPCFAVSGSSFLMKKYMIIPPINPSNIGKMYHVFGFFRTTLIWVPHLLQKLPSIGSSFPHLIQKTI